MAGSERAVSKQTPSQQAVSKAGSTDSTSVRLTPRQRRILDVIHRTVRERGYPPTVREIGEAVGLTSSSSVHAQLENLERLGALRKDPTKPRAITTSEPKLDGVVVPLVGRIAAGAPVLAAESVEEYLTVPMGFASDGSPHFALQVRGDSMIGAGIFDGDVVVIRQQDHADDGDIVAALLPGPAEDEATVKRLKLVKGGRVMLVPENPALQPFEMTDGRLLGKVVSVLRKL
jgi:repressor LexA